MTASQHVDRRILPAGVDLVAVCLVVAALVLTYSASYLELAKTVWQSDEQGHGPIIFAVAVWLLYQSRHDLARLSATSTFSAGIGYALLLLGSLFLIVGYSQDISTLAIGSQIVVLAALALIFCGPGGLRRIWFPLFFMVFMIPLPEALVAMVTAPLKTAVSVVASQVLYATGYPVGRSGVILTVGQYQLLVADACAGLNSMFTLEALGMLYMNIMNYTSVARNVTLAVLLVPIAFLANVCRVMILVLVTYYFGDAAGQGFVHGFAGMVLFLVALALMLAVDRVLDFFFVRQKKAGAKP